MTNAAIARIALGIIFIYHGLVPKILFLSETEVRMIQAHGLSFPVEAVALVAGIAEIVLGLALLVLQKATWPVALATAALCVLLVDTAIFSPGLLVQAFNPVSTNIAGIALCFIVLEGTASAKAPGKS